MNARVSQAFKAWPTFYALQETQKAGRRVHVSGDPDEQINYAKALYACCYDGVPVGREGVSIVCEPANNDDDMVAALKGRRMKAG